MSASEKKLGLAAFIMIYFMLKPLYIGASGNMQICDYFLAFSILYLIFEGPEKIVFDQNSFSVTKLYIVVLFYQIVINAIWSVITESGAMNRHDLYYVFNFIAFLECLYVGQRAGVDSIKRAVGLGSFFGVIITAVGLLFFSGPQSRGTGFFNNPNQLGYYAVIMLTVVALCRKQLNRIQIGTIIVVSFWASIISLSKAAIIAYFAEAIILIMFYQNNQSLKRIIIELILLSVIAFIIYFLFYSDSRIVLDNKTLFDMRNRIINMSEENDSGLAYGRGYARVGEMLPHILWGTGEGAYNRFTVRHGTEVHSTFASLLTCYGLIGLIGYLVIFIKCMGRGGRLIQNIIALAGLFLYAITHNGIRNTLLWMIMALLLLESNEEKNQYLHIPKDSNEGAGISDE